MTLAFGCLLFLAITTMKVNITGFDEKYLSKDTTLSIKGLFVILVFLSHIKNYVDFCARCLREYFCAIKKNFKQQWEDPNSKMLSVISLNGFIIAYTRQLSKYGTNNFAFYDEKFAKWEYDFSKENFQYTSSQYRMFSSEILKGAFDFSDEELETT